MISNWRNTSVSMVYTCLLLFIVIAASLSLVWCGKHISIMYSITTMYSCFYYFEAFNKCTYIYIIFYFTILCIVYYNVLRIFHGVVLLPLIIIKKPRLIRRATQHVVYMLCIQTGVLAVFQGWPITAARRDTWILSCQEFGGKLRGIGGYKHVPPCHCTA